MAEAIHLDHDLADQGLADSEIDLIDTCVTTDEKTIWKKFFKMIKSTTISNPR